MGPTIGMADEQNAMFSRHLFIRTAMVGVNPLVFASIPFISRYYIQLHHYYRINFYVSKFPRTKPHKYCIQ